MKNKERTILCVLIATVFLMPLMGNTALADTVTYYFNSYDPNEAWENPSGNGASTTIDGDVHLLNGNTCPDANLGTIIKVELRTKGFYILWGDDRDIILRPVFPCGDGDNHTFDAPAWPGGWSEWFDITIDINAPSPWTWSNVTNLDCDVEAENNPLGGWFTLFFSIVQIQVTYITG